MSSYILVPIKDGCARVILKGEFVSIYELNKQKIETEFKFQVIEDAVIGDKFLKVIPDMRN